MADQEKPQKPQLMRIEGELITSGSNSTVAEVRVKEVPKVLLESPTDIVAVLSFLITALVVIGTTWLTIRNYQRTVDLQGRIADKDAELQRTKTRVDILSKNRQDWINTLRNTLAEYISAALALAELKKLRRAIDSDLSHADGAVVDWNYRVHAAIAETVRLKAKIALLSNPAEEDFQKLMEAVAQVQQAAQSNDALSLSENSDSLVAISQKILKNEWERVKRVE